MFDDALYLCSRHADGTPRLRELDAADGRYRCAFASRQLAERFIERWQPDDQEPVALLPFDELNAGLLYDASSELIMVDSEDRLVDLVAMLRGSAEPGGL